MIQAVGAPERILAQARNYKDALGDQRDKKLWIKRPSA